MAGRDFSAELFGDSAKPVVGRDFSAELFGTKPKDEGFLSNVGKLALEGGERAIGAARVSPSVISGDVGKEQAKVISEQLAMKPTVQPKELTEVTTAFKEEAEALKKAEGFKESVVPTLQFMAEFGKQALTNPKGVAYLTAQSAANMAPSILGMIAGGKAGAALGTVVAPGPGTAIGGISGAIAGGFAGSAPMEIGAEFIDNVGKELRARGMEPTQENVEAILSDRSFVQKAVSEARTKGATTAAVDAAMTAGAGRYATGPRRAAIKAAQTEMGAAADAAAVAKRAEEILKQGTRAERAGRAIKRGAGAVGIDVAGGGLSEAAGQYAAYGEIDPESVALEMLGELGGAAIEVPSAAYATGRDALKAQARKQAQEIIERERAPEQPTPPVQPPPAAEREMSLEELERAAGMAPAEEPATLEDLISEEPAPAAPAKPAAVTEPAPEAAAPAAETPVQPGYVRVYHSGSPGEGETGRWASTSKEYASNYRPDLPLFYTDIPASDPRVTNPDYPDQGVEQGFTFNFELTPEEAVTLKETPREEKKKEYVSPLESIRSREEQEMEGRPTAAEEMEGVPAPMLPEIEEEVGKLTEDQAAAVAEREKLEKRTAGTSLMQVLKGTLNDNELSELGGRARKVGKNQFLNLKAPKDRVGSSMEDMVESGRLDLFLPENMRPDHPDYVNSESAEYIRDKLRNNQFYTYETELEIKRINQDIESIERRIQELLSDDDINKEIQYAVDEQRELDQAAAEPAPEGEAGVAEERAGEEEILKPQTEEDLREKAAREEEAARKEEEDRKEEERKAAAPKPEEFVLTGSERAADEAAARGQMELAPAEPETLAIGTEQERKTATQNLKKSLATGVPEFRARGGDGRVTIIKPKRLSGSLMNEVFELVSEALDLGLPPAVLGNVKAAGSTRSDAVAMMTTTGWLLIGKQWSTSSRAEKLSAIVHELGHSVDTEAGKISEGAKWNQAHKELGKWYATAADKFKHPLAYPFAPQYRGKVRMEAESFAQAFAHYFVAPVDLQKNAPEAYSQIQSIVERIQNESQQARAAGTTTTGTAGIKIQPARVEKGPAVQPEAGKVSTAVSPAKRVEDRGAAKVTPIPLTADERAYFDSVFQSPNDLADLQELAPSAQLTDEGLIVSPEDLSGLEDYVADTWAAAKKTYGGEGAASIPKSFSSAGDRFIKKARQSLPGIDMMQAPQKGRENILGEVTTGNWTLQPDTKLDTKDSVIYKLLDKNVDLKRVVQAIKSTGQEIATRWNPYLQEELYHGRTAKQTQDFMAKEVKPLIEEMDKEGVTIGELEQYLHNRHAEAYNKHVAKVNPNTPEMQDGGSGITTEAARKYLADLPADKRRVYEKLAERIDAMTKGTRELLVNSGLEKRETIDAWEKTFPDYVPLMREEEDFEYTTGSFGVGQGFDVRGSFSKRAMGSKRNVVDILANALLSRERAIVKAEKNRVAQAVYGLAIQNGNPDFWLAVNPMAEKVPQVALDELAQMNIDPEAIKFLMKEPRQRAVDPKKNEVISRINTTLRGNKNVLSMRLNGENRYVFFNPNNERAKRAATALKNLDAQNLGAVLGFLGRITRYMASVNTQYNPIFGAYNFLRDVQGAALQLSTTPIAGKQKQVLENVGPSLKAIFQSLRKGEKTDTEMGRLWDDFQKAGGQTGFRDMYSRSQDRAEALLDEFNKMADGRLKKAGRYTLKLLSDYNDTMENAVRLSAYKVALDSGFNKEEAASIAKNLTVNFNRKGEIATQAGALYAFFNASMQGTARLIETLKGPAGKKIVYGGLLWGVIQSAMLALAGFDEEEPPEFVRERNFIIPIFGTDKYVAFPMPLGYHVIPGTSRAITDAFMAMAGVTKSSKTMAERVTDLTGMYLEAFNPIGNAGWSGQTISPTPFDPLVALWENRDWTGKKIAKEDINKLDPTPGYTRAKDAATWYSTKIAEFLNLASGGTKYQPGIASPTPDQIDYLIGQVFGGVGREVAKLATTIEKTATGEELPPYKVPLLGRFYGETKSSAAEAGRFYKNLEHLNKLENEIKGRRENREPLGTFLADNPEARLAKRANEIYSDIKKLRDRKEKLVERDAPRESVKAVENQITMKMRMLNEQVERAKK